MRVALIVNPRAGGGRARGVMEAALPILREHGVEPVVEVCANGLEPAARARAAVGAGAEIVVAVGGDGQAAAVAHGIIGSGVPLGILPSGSANDYARTLGLPVGDISAAVGVLLRRHCRHVDAVRVTSPDGERHFLNVGGTGFDWIVARRSERIPVLSGAARYVVAVMRELPTFRPGCFRLSVDGREHEVQAMMVAVANGSTYGGGMRVAPAARLDSGRLEVCIVHAVSKAGFIRAFPLVFSGRHVDHPRVTMLHGRRIAISADREFGLTGDGEMIGRLPATFEVMPAALPVVVGLPAGAD